MAIKKATTTTDTPVELTSQDIQDIKSKLNLDNIDNQSFSDIVNTVNSISAGEGGVIYDTLAEAQGLTNPPSNGTIFQVSKQTDPNNSGRYSFQSSEPNGTRPEPEEIEVNVPVNKIPSKVLTSSDKCFMQVEGLSENQKTEIENAVLNIKITKAISDRYYAIRYIENGLNGNYRMRISTFKKSDFSLQENQIIDLAPTSNTGISIHNVENGIIGNLFIELNRDEMDTYAGNDLVVINEANISTTERTVEQTYLKRLAKNDLDMDRFNHIKTQTDGQTSGDSNQVINSGGKYIMYNPNQVITNTNSDMISVGLLYVYVENAKKDTYYVFERINVNDSNGRSGIFVGSVNQSGNFLEKVDNFQTRTVSGITVEELTFTSGEKIAITINWDKYTFSNQFGTVGDKIYIDNSRYFLEQGTNTGGSTTSVNLNKRFWYEFTEGGSDADYSGYFPNFRKLYREKTKDVNIIATGTSLIARSVHNTIKSDANIRPPGMDVNNLINYLWDKIKWTNQYYRRADVSGFFSEIGSFQTKKGDGSWDDSSNRDTPHKIADGNSQPSTVSVSFDVPTNAWQFNVIYKEDIVGHRKVDISIAEGNSQMEVYNGTNWVEANGYSFSQRSTQGTLSSLAIPNPNDVNNATRNISVKTRGNNNDQKRLKFRCKNYNGLDSRNITKSITLTPDQNTYPIYYTSVSDAERFQYWGVEWSEREFMISLINSSRGGHGTRIDNTDGTFDTSGLPAYQDNEVWDFDPDLIFMELPIHNDGIAGVGSHVDKYTKHLVDNYVTNVNSPVSLTKRATDLGKTIPEIGMFQSSIPYTFAVDGTGNSAKWKVVDQTDERGKTALDKYSEAHQFIKENYPNILSINSSQRWTEAAEKIYDNLELALAGTGKTGDSMTFDGTHWNDNGDKIMAKTVLPVFKLI